MTSWNQYDIVYYYYVYQYTNIIIIIRRRYIPVDDDGAPDRRVRGGGNRNIRNARRRRHRCWRLPVCPVFAKHMLFDGTHNAHTPLARVQPGHRRTVFYVGSLLKHNKSQRRLESAARLQRRSCGGIKIILYNIIISCTCRYIWIILKRGVRPPPTLLSNSMIICCSVRRNIRKIRSIPPALSPWSIL